MTLGPSSPGIGPRQSTECGDALYRPPVSCVQYQRMVVVMAVFVGVVVVVIVVIVVEKARSDCEQWSYDYHPTI